MQDVKADLSAFRQMLEALPGQLGSTTSVQACAKVFVRGGEAQHAHNVPGWVGAMGFAKPWLSTRAGEAVVGKDVARILPLMDEEVATLGAPVWTSTPRRRPSPRSSPTLSALEEPRCAAPVPAE